MIWIFSYNQASIIWLLSVRVFPPDTVPQWILRRCICHFLLLFALVRFHQIQASRHHSFRLKPDLSHGSWCQTAFLTNRSVYSGTCTISLYLYLSPSLSLSGRITKCTSHAIFAPIEFQFSTTCNISLHS